MIPIFSWILVYLLVFGFPPSITAQCRVPCRVSAFTPFLPSGVTIEKTYEVPGGSGLNGSYGEGAPLDLGHPTNATNLPHLCAVTVRVSLPNASSSYRFGLFLPPNCTWNSRFLTVGNYAQAGGINWADMGQGPHYGMATLSTDTGHNSVESDLSWGLNNPQALQDWGWRALKGSVEIGKALVEGYYGRRISYSYWSGCSTGGRQGLKQVQVAPDAFDGVLVGAPAWDTQHLFPWITRLAALNRPGTAGFLDNAGIELLRGAVQRQCVLERTEATRGRVADPFDGCALDWSRIRCPGDDPAQCLTDAQVSTAMSVYADYHSNATTGGRATFPGMPLGSEALWGPFLVGGPQVEFNEAYERYWLYNNASWSLADYDEGRVVADSERINPGNATADDFNVSRFRDGGGKILMYHGRADGIVPTGSSQAYYDRTVEAMGEVDDFFRLFHVPGMYHCWYTDTTVNAPWIMGGAGQAVRLQKDLNFGQGWSVPGFEGNGTYDALVALMDWVESKGAKPVEKVIATTYDGTRLKQRPLCKWPAKAQYKGAGDVYKADSWSCV
ncbi:tannase and feruloyl esterase [Cladorrhinum samala]|uniref:Carboxylic ester hydrolase n=1 Tax=Cladorrhinum samala TaxID=585594 RepID=A0AAV9HVU6_9PEZI|nr:tannase and feruloyl esterase [Cladorrhinum samala]